MKTPIVDFVKDYVNQDFLRLHMPGHKGKDNFGFEKFDITEIDRLKAVGIKTITLGRRILRTETAGEAVLAMLMYGLNEI